jgi:peptide/nickel transport system permease protein
VGLYILRRLGQALVVLLGITTGSFLLLHLVPGSAANVILGVHASPAAVAQLTRQLGLNTPLPLQYWNFIRRAAELNFGQSAVQDVPVSGLLAHRLGPTLFLAAYATVLSIVISVPLAILSALHRNRPADHLVRLSTMVTFAMPVFWLALLLIILGSVKLHAFPVSGYGQGFVGHLDNLALPALTLSLGLAPLIIRTLRGDLIDTMNKEFVEAARARGLGERRVFSKYLLRNSLVSSTTVIGVNVATILGTVVVVENVFVLPGIGSLLVSAVQSRDLPVVQAVVLVIGALVVLVNLLTDLAYALIDPRVRLNGRHHQ